jgi:putative membrane protein
MAHVIWIHSSRRRNRPSLWKGFVAGAIGGLAGSAAKAAAESLYPPRIEGQPVPPVVLAEKVSGRQLNLQLNSDQKKRVAMVVHRFFGTLTGGIYGALAEHQRWITSAGGTLFAAGLLLATHEAALPALGLSAPPSRQVPREQASEAVTHLVYGITVESLRKWTRPAL